MATNFRNRVAVLGAALMLGGVLGGCASDRPASAVMDDTAITTKVKSAFATDKDVSAMKVHVQTTNGRVHLTGQVKSVEEKRKAEEVARRVNGVQSVDNDLQVARN